eukprot:5840758-Prymnesium_polylepis.1
MLSGDLRAAPGAVDTRPTGHYELWLLTPRAAAGAAACWLHAVGLMFDDSGGHERPVPVGVWLWAARSQRLGTVIIVATADASGQALGGFKWSELRSAMWSYALWSSSYIGNVRHAATLEP